MGVVVGHVLPYFNTHCPTKTAQNDLLLTPLCFLLPVLCRPSPHNPPGEPGESLRAPCDDQRVLERSWQPIICLLVASCMASHFRRVPFLIFLPGELFHVRNGLVVSLCLDTLLWKSDSDRSVLHLLGRKSAQLCFPTSSNPQVCTTRHPASKISPD